MKISKCLAVALLLILFVGCQKFENDFDSTNDLNTDSEFEVIQERDPNYPFSGSDEIMAGAAATRTVGNNEASLSECLGRSCKLKFFPYEDMNNIGFSVIDIQKFKLAHPNDYQSTQTNSTNMHYMCATGFSRLDQQVENFNKFTVGAESSGFMVKREYKQTFKEKFSFFTSKIEENVFAEAEICFIRRTYELKALNNVLETIKNNYIHQSFYYDLYHNSVGNFYSEYGGFVLLKFGAGGKASILYAAECETTNTTTTIEQENDLYKKLGVKIGKVGGNTSVTVGNTDSSTINTETKFQQTLFTLKTLGGSPVCPVFASPQDINTTLIDLTSWCASLQNDDNLAIALLPEQSLMQIASFIEEENIRTKIGNLIKHGWGAVKPKEPLLKPRIEVCLAKMGINEDTWETRLLTRYGNYIMLKNKNVKKADSNKYLEDELKLAKNRFPYLDIIKVFNYYRIIGGGGIQQPEPPYDFDFERMTKFVDPKSGKTYLMPKKPVIVNPVTLKAAVNSKPIAYTLYDQRVINDYTFQGYIDKMETANTSVEYIRENFRLIAL